MRIGFMTALALAAGIASAEDTALSGDQIKAMLTDQKVLGEGTTQVFYASGRTLYNDGHDSWGYWEVRGDQYCSTWPPQNGWACYDMFTRQTDTRLEIVFIGESGKEYPTWLAPKESQ
ncbi:MAG: hypothetical protein AAGH74_04890 [Pseudomonadota bacterium]